MDLKLQRIIQSHNCMHFQYFDQQLDFLNQFVHELAVDYQARNITSWDDLDRKVKAFFTSECMNQLEAIVPGWKQMASYLDGVTLTHVMCVFLGLVMLPEYQSLSSEQQQLAKWIVLFHDVEKAHIRGKRDLTHGFRGALLTARTLKKLGFEHKPEYDKVIHSWCDLVGNAFTKLEAVPEPIQDNQKLPEIIQGLERMYGKNTPAALITQGVLLHMSINVVKDFPQAAPLTPSEIKRYIDRDLLPLLKVMMLADNEGWVLFEPETRIIQRNETLGAFQEIEIMIAD